MIPKVIPIPIKQTWTSHVLLMNQGFMGAACMKPKKILIPISVAYSTYQNRITCSSPDITVFPKSGPSELKHNFRERNFHKTYPCSNFLSDSFCDRDNVTTTT